MNVPIYNGDPIWNPNSVPFGFYNNSIDFQTDCVKVAEFCATRLGYPLVDIELQSSPSLLHLKKQLPYMEMNYMLIS